MAAACCGTYGFRASAGAVPMQGVVSVTPSLEAVAWTAPDMDTLQQVGAALQLPGARICAHMLSTVVCTLLACRIKALNTHTQ